MADGERLTLRKALETGRIAAFAAQAEKDGVGPADEAVFNEALRREVNRVDAKQPQAFAALIDACAAPDVQRIIFLDAPRVIGPEAWRAIELKYAYGGMSAMLAQLIEAGVLQPYAIELLAPVLLSVLAETSRAVSLNPASRDAAHHLMTRMLDALRVGEGVEEGDRRGAERPVRPSSGPSTP